MVYAVVVAVPIGVLALLIRTRFGPLVTLDQNVIVRATDFTRPRPWLRSLASGWQAISQPWVVYLVVGLPACAVAWFRFHLHTRALWALATMATGWTIASVLKALVQRARPVVENPFDVHTGYSFPSGHSTNNAIVVTVILVLLHPVLNERARRALLAVGVVWVLVTCADRVLLGAHFPSDVVAGVVLGCGICLASYAGYTDWSPPSPTDSTKGVL